MKIGIPKNIFASMFSLLLSDEQKAEISVLNSASLATEIQNDNLDIAFIPSLDLMKHSDLFVSSKIGIAFESEISNSFIYYKKNQSTINEILVRGDVSVNEIILSKIIFSELYDTEIEIKLDTKELDLENNNNLIVGNQNYEKSLFENGVSLSNQLSDLLDGTYVNYILVSKDEEKLNAFEASITNIDKQIIENFIDLASKLKLEDSTVEFLQNNLDTLFFDLSEVERSSLQEMIKLPYLHGIVKDIVEIKFTKQTK